jgi:hypothetical protein
MNRAMPGGRQIRARVKHPQRAESEKNSLTNTSELRQFVRAGQIATTSSGSVSGETIHQGTRPGKMLSVWGCV